MKLPLVQLQLFRASFNLSLFCMLPFPSATISNQCLNSEMYLKEWLKESVNGISHPFFWSRFNLASFASWWIFPVTQLGSEMTSHLFYSSFCPGRVEVEFYVNENTFKERLKLFFIKNQRSSKFLCWEMSNRFMVTIIDGLICFPQQTLMRGLFESDLVSGPDLDLVSGPKPRTARNSSKLSFFLFETYRQNLARLKSQVSASTIYYGNY